MVQLTVLMADDNTDFKGCWLASESEQEMEDLCYTGKYYIWSIKKECSLLNINIYLHV